MPSASLEQEALDRVARMYSTFERRQNSRHEPPDDPKPPKPEPSPEPEASEPQPVGQEAKSAGMLEYLLKDKEQSLILLLLVILMKDGADMNAVLALMYLLI